MCENFHLSTYFHSRKIAFNDYDVEEATIYRKEFDQLKGTGYPLIFVNKVRIEGFDKERIEAALHK